MLRFCLILFVALVTSCDRAGRKTLGVDHRSPKVLLFNGTGISKNDIAAIEQILTTNNIDYETADSQTLNTMTLDQLNKYQLFLVPGGNFIEMGQSLTESTASNIRAAIQQGVNYFGICAGAFLAGQSSYYNGFNLTSGITFGFYSLEKQGVRKSAVAISNPDGSMLDQYWEDGPQLAGWGDVVAKYPDKTPAVTEGKYGKGFVLLSGIHAEAPAYWRGSLVFRSSADDDNRYAATLISTALKGRSLPHY